jgi:hypothetical protein
LIIAKCIYEYIHEGKDYQHVELDSVPAIKGLLGSIFVGRNYHALHHIYPEVYFSSVIGLFDFVFGKLAYFKTKKIYFDIENSHFVENLKETALSNGAKLSETMNCDILVINKSENTKTKIQEFYEINKDKKIAPEIWVITHKAENLESPENLYIREIILSKKDLDSSLSISKVWPKLIRNYQIM